MCSVASRTFSQTVSSNATVTIIGDPVSESASGGGAGTNPYINESEPPEKGQQLASPQNIEPTFENGFHIRYEVFETQKKTEERPSNTGYEYASLESSGGSVSGGSKMKKKHSVNMTEKSFNFRKKLKTWMPKRKKKYRPNVCGRF